MWNKELWTAIKELKKANDELENNIDAFSHEVGRRKELISKGIQVTKEEKSPNKNEKLIIKLQKLSFIIFITIFIWFPFYIFYLQNKPNSKSYIQLDNIDIFGSLMSPILIWLVIFFLWKIDSYDMKGDIEWVKDSIMLFVIMSLFIMLMFYFLFEVNINNLFQWN